MNVVFLGIATIFFVGAVTSTLIAVASFFFLQWGTAFRHLGLLILLMTGVAATDDVSKAVTGASVQEFMDEMNSDDVGA